MQRTQPITGAAPVRSLLCVLPSVLVLTGCGGGGVDSSSLDAQGARSIVTRSVETPGPNGMELRTIEYYGDELVVLLPDGALSTGGQKSCGMGQALIRSEALQSELSGVLQAKRIREMGSMTHEGAGCRLYLLSGLEVDPYDYALEPGGGMMMAEPNYVLRLEQNQARGQAGGPGSFVDPTVPEDRLFPEQWALSNKGQTSGTPGADIDFLRAWSIERGSNDVVVGMIDSGIDFTHRDLRTRMWVNEGEIPGNGVDDDGNGYVDDYYGYDFFGDQPNPWDDHRHGTHTAGTVAAASNHGAGVIGVASQCKVMALKAFSVSGSGSSAAAAEAVMYGVDMGAKITSNSYGSAFYSQILDMAFQYAFDRDVVSVASAGNNSIEAPRYPAALDTVLSVAATDHNDSLAFFSNFGKYVDLAAPGHLVLSTVPEFWDPSGYAIFSGTSMACPHVAGVAALIRSRDPLASNRAVIAALKTAVDPVDEIVDMGTGRCNAYKAVLRAHNPELIARVDEVVEVEQGRISIYGAAGGQDFRRYYLEVGTGSYPSLWTPLQECFASVEDGLLGTLDLAHLPTGMSRVRVRVEDNAFRGVIDSVPYSVDNFKISEPLSYDVLGKGEVLEVRGSVSVSGFTSYRLEWQPYVLDNGFPTPSGPWSSQGIVLANGGNFPIFRDTLGTFDTSLVQGTDRCYLRLTAEGSSIVETVDLYLDSKLESGWPVRVPHDSSYQGDLSILDPVLFDLDQNGAIELYALMTGRLHGYRADGDALPGFPVQLPVSSGETYTTSALTLCDVDGDGSMEIVFGGVRDRTIQIHAYESTGAPTTGFPLSWTYGNTDNTILRANSSVVAADVDADGVDELIYQAFDLLVITELDGTLKTGQLVHLRPGAGTSCARTSLETSVDATPAVANMDGDPELEIVVFHDDPNCTRGAQGVLRVLNPNGSLVPGWPRTTTFGGAGGSPVIGDLDGQGGNEIVIAAGTNFRTGGIHVFDASGNLLPGWPQYEDILAFACSPTLVDLDEDGDLEIMVADADGPYVLLMDHTGASYGPGFVSGISSPYAVSAVDVDQDGVPDIAASENRYPNSGSMDYGTGAQAWNVSGATLPGFPMVTESNTWAPMQVLDIDGDGFVEGIGSSFKDVGEGYWTGEDKKRRGSIYVWELPYPVSPNARSLWPTFHGNLQRTGYYQ